MSRQIIKQPNGKYCIFSNIVDNITHYDMTPEEIIEVWVEEYKKDISEKVNLTIKQLDEGELPYYQFTRNYEEMIEIIERNHGKEYAEEIKTLIDN